MKHPRRTRATNDTNDDIVILADLALLLLCGTLVLISAPSLLQQVRSGRHAGAAPAATAVRIILQGGNST